MDPALGDADCPQAVELATGVATSVLLEPGARAVKAPAVRFHDQAGVGPEEVGVVAEDAHVDLRLGQAGLPDEGEELALELGAGPGDRVGDLGQGGPQSLRRAARRAVEEVLDGAAVEELEALGRLEHGAQLLGTGGAA